jgi:hypothetical protein
MSEGEMLIPGEFLHQVFEHVARTRKPLLREPSPDDDHVIWARGGNPEYELDLADASRNPYYDELGDMETWGHMAAYLNMDVEDLFREAKRRGYQYMPYEDQVEETLEESGSLDDLTLFEPHDLAECMKHRLPGTQLEDLLAGVPAWFRWDPATASPGIPQNPDDARDWNANDGALGGVRVTHERSGSGSIEVTWVASPAALSCLQYVLDEMGRDAQIQLVE